MALGARPRDIVALVVGEGVRVTAAGVVVGFVVALAAARLMRSLLYDVSATDAAICTVVALVTGAVAVFASYVPAINFASRRQIPPPPRVALGDSRGALRSRNFMTMSPARSDPPSGSARSVATR